MQINKNITQSQSAELLFFHERALSIIVRVCWYKDGGGGGECTTLYPYISIYINRPPCSLRSISDDHAANLSIVFGTARHKNYFFIISVSDPDP
jgi:hypothetical protein